MKYSLVLLLLTSVLTAFSSPRTSHAAVIVALKQTSWVFVQAYDRDDGANPITKLSDTFEASGENGYAYAEYSASSQGLSLHLIADAIPNLGAIAEAVIGLNVSSTTGAPVRYRGVDGTAIVPSSGIVRSKVLISNHSNSFARQKFDDAIVFSDGEYFPGETPDIGELEGEELEGEELEGDGKDPDRVIGGVDIANDVTGSYLTSLPVVDTYGHTDFVYLKVADQPGLVTATSPLVFASDIAFAAITVPASAGSGTYEIEINGSIQTLAVGAILDFTSIDPSGVSNFRLWPSVPGDALPLRAGFRFAEEGATQVLQGVPVPEPSTLVLGMIGCVLMLCWSKRCK